jgi:hypothetical protein
MKRNYKKLHNAYNKENFFISSAVRGPIIDKEDGVRQGMPIIGPINGPVKEPSPLNSEYVYDFDMSIKGDKEGVI